MPRKARIISLCAILWSSSLAAQMAAPQGIHTPIAHKPDIGQTIRHATVRIISKEDNGSGIVLKRLTNGYVLIASAAHVVASNEQYTCIEYHNHENALGKIVRIGSANDLDLIFIISRSSLHTDVDYLSNKEASTSDAVVAIGYAAGSESITASDGFIVERLSIPLAGGYAIASTSNVSKGMSGGGLYDSLGGLAGMNATHADPLWEADLYRVDGTRLSEQEKLRLENYSLAVPFKVIKEKENEYRANITKQLVGLSGIDHRREALSCKQRDRARGR